MKRAIDMFSAIFGLVLLWPLLGLIAAAVFVASGPPIIFSQERVGLGGRPFRMKKFRTMRVLQGADQGRFDPGGGDRTTFLGNLLRAYKLDELPQLWNVLKGEMSMVGPRPEVREWVDAYPDRWRKVLSVKPGITDPASLLYRDEESVLAAYPDPEKAYREVILPNKLDIYEKYVDNRTLFGDFGVVLRTLGKVFFRSQGS